MAVRLIITALLFLSAQVAHAQCQGATFLALQAFSSTELAHAKDILKASPRPCFSFLHGTFGHDLTNPRSLIRDLLLEHPRFRSNPRVYIYLDCGPCRPPRRNGSLETWLWRTSIPRLNKLLEGEEPPLASWRQWAMEISPLFAEFPEVKFTVFPQLESNLTLKAERLLIDELRSIYPPTVRFAVNRLDERRILGLAMEVHRWSTKGLRRRDYISGDGIDSQPTCEQLKQIRRAGIHYFLWRGAWQGASAKHPNRPASRRVYDVRAKKKTIKRLIKCG